MIATLALTALLAAVLLAGLRWAGKGPEAHRTAPRTHAGVIGGVLGHREGDQTLRDGDA